MDRVENPDEVQAYIDETLKKNDLEKYRKLIADLGIRK